MKFVPTMSSKDLLRSTNVFSFRSTIVAAVLQVNNPTQYLHLKLRHDKRILRTRIGIQKYPDSSPLSRSYRDAPSPNDLRYIPPAFLVCTFFPRSSTQSLLKRKKERKKEKKNYFRKFPRSLIKDIYAIDQIELSYLSFVKSPNYRPTLIMNIYR